MNRPAAELLTGVIAAAATAAAVALVSGTAARFMVLAVVFAAIGAVAAAAKVGIAARASGVAAVVAGWEAVLFGLVVPSYGSRAVPVAAGIAGEILIPAVLAAIVWTVLLPGRRVAQGAAVLVLAVVFCAAGFVVSSPLAARGAAEEMGWRAKPQGQPHMTGIHTAPFPRHLAYVWLCAVAGVVVALSAGGSPSPGALRLSSPAERERTRVER